MADTVSPDASSEFILRTDSYARFPVSILLQSHSAHAIARHVASVKMTQADELPFYVFDTGKVIERVKEWRYFLPRVKAFYSVKCNNDPVLLRVLADCGLGFDCASKREMDQILEQGLTGPDKIVFANPVKTRSHLKHAAQAGVNLMTFDNGEELCKIEQFHENARMLLRIAVSDASAQCPLNIKFGCDPMTTAPKLLRLALQMRISVVGISFHVGSGCKDARAFAEAIGHARRLFDIGSLLGHKMHLLDMGGGFPGHHTEHISFQQIAQVINEALDVHFGEIDVGSVSVIAEPGRFFASSAFTLVTNVIANTRVAASRITQNAADVNADGYMYYLNDGVYGSFNCILYDHSNPRGTPLFEEEGEETIASIWGPTCDSLDQIVKCCLMRRLVEGDWIVWDNMGAYTSCAGSEFNGFPRPSVHYFATSHYWDKLREFGIGSKNKLQELTSECDDDWQSTVGSYSGESQLSAD